MNRLLTLALTAALAFSLAGCGGGGVKDKDKDKDKDHKDHVHKDDKAKDKKDKKDKDDEHGEPMALGKVTAGAYEITGTQLGKVEKGAGVLEVQVKGVTKGAAVVRGWIGSEDGKGAVKAKAEYEADEDAFHIHAETGEKLAEGAKWWVEIEPTGGKAVTASFDIKK